MDFLNHLTYLVMISNRFSFLWQQLWRQLGKISRYLALSLLCFALVLGCNGNPSPNRNADNGGRISVGTTLKPRTLDPADSYELAGLNIIYNVGESL